MRGRQADQVITVAAGDRRLLAAIRPGTGGGPPLVLCNGIGTPLEALEPFTSVLDPAIEVVRFDVPGVGGSPAPSSSRRSTRGGAGAWCWPPRRPGA